MCALPRLPGELVGPARRRRIVRGAWQFVPPIQEQGARVLLLGLRRASTAVSAHGCRLLSIGDNLSSIFSFAKGRS
eukprot:2094302-Lingulodinium_polyedra.AAC.1